MAPALVPSPARKLTSDHSSTPPPGWQSVKAPSVTWQKADGPVENAWAPAAGARAVSASRIRVERTPATAFLDASMVTSLTSQTCRVAVLHAAGRKSTAEAARTVALRTRALARFTFSCVPFSLVAPAPYPVKVAPSIISVLGCAVLDHALHPTRRFFMRQATIPGLFALFLVLGIPALAQKTQSEVGEVSFANSGSPAAQEPFLRGLALLHNFEYAD